MKLDEMILVTENWKGLESNALMTLDDFIAYIGLEQFDTKMELAELMVKLGRTLGKEEEWAELYFAANKSVYARYCTDVKQLQSFLRGEFNSTDLEWRFLEESCSAKCQDRLKALGMNTKGWLTGMGLHYEKEESDFRQGDIVHNFNGNDYRIMELLSEKNLLLMDVRNGTFTVGINTETFVRYPKGEEPTEDNCQVGIEWGHGVYFSSTPSAINFKRIREEYGTKKEIETIGEYRSSLAERFDLYHHLANTGDVSREVRNAATNAMYEEFGTGKVEVFNEQLEDGRYDGGFERNRETQRGRGR